MYDKFVQLLQKNNKTTYQVAKNTGINQAVFSKWKKGVSVPKTEKLLKIADYFGVDVRYFFEDRR